MKLESLKMNFQSLKSGLNNQKSYLFNEKITKSPKIITNHISLLDLEFIRMTCSLRGRAKSSRPRRQVNRLKIPFYARITSFVLIHFDLLAKFITLKGVLHRQRRHWSLQPAAVEWVVWIHSFKENKPNFKNIEISVSSFQTRKYEISPAWRGKKQTQFKANLSQNKADSNPITEMPKMNVRNAITMNYKKFVPLAGAKTNPIQSQYKPNTRLSSNVVVGGPISNTEKRTKEAKKKKRASGNFLHLWIAGKIDFLDGFDILLGKIYGKSQFNLFGRLIS